MAVAEGEAVEGVVVAEEAPVPPQRLEAQETRPTLPVMAGRRTLPMLRVRTELERLRGTRPTAWPSPPSRWRTTATRPVMDITAITDITGTMAITG